MASGGSLRRFVSRTIVQQIGPVVQVATAPHQCVMSTQVGCESIAHLLQARMDQDHRATVLFVDGIGTLDLVSCAAFVSTCLCPPASANVAVPLTLLATIAQLARGLESLGGEASRWKVLVPACAEKQVAELRPWCEIWTLQPLHDGTPTPGAADSDGAARARLVVLAGEVPGRWSEGARARNETKLVRRRVEQGWRLRWWTMLSCAATRAFAASLLGMRF